MTFKYIFLIMLEEMVKSVPTLTPIICLEYELVEDLIQQSWFQETII